jgi:hypothetical protein
MIFQLTFQYFAYSVITNSDILRELSTPFPTVTLCDYNMFNTEEGYEFVKRARSGFNNIFSKSEQSNKSKIRTIQSEIKYSKSLLYQNKTLYNNFELRKNLSLTLDKMILGCYFGSKECNISDFEYFFDINFGNCYRFNSGINSENQSITQKKVISSGDNSGLQLGLYLGPQDINNNLSFSTGLYLAIHNQTFRGLLPNNGLNIPAGRITLIGNFQVNQNY